MGGANWHPGTPHRGRLRWGLSGAWGLDPDDPSPLSSLFPLFHSERPQQDPLYHECETLSPLEALGSGVDTAEQVSDFVLVGLIQ